METDDVDLARTVYSDPADAQSTTLANDLSISVRPIAEAPNGWHLEARLGQLNLVGSDGTRFALDGEDIERRSRGFARSGLAKACAASKRPRILDALSGWGTDGLVLALAGCEVTCCEVSPLIATMNRVRAWKMAPNTEVHSTDAMTFMANTARVFDVVYLDAMFPDHPTGAKPSKALQILAELAQDCDVEELRVKALELAIDRVVVKRRRNQRLNEAKPHWTVQGKTVRFDVYRVSSSR